MKDNTQTKKVLKTILFLNLFVLIIELIAGVATRSLGILAGAVHSAVDMVNNIVGLVVLKYSNEPPDEKHPYGHGKFETLAAFVIVTFLAVAFIELLKEAVSRVLHPVELPLFKMLAVVLLICTLIVNVFVWLYERKKGLELDSALLLADSTHTGVDVLITSAVLLSQIFVAKGMYWVDPAIAIVIAVIIAYGAYEIIRQTVPVLVDEAWHDATKIKDFILSIDNVVDCYDVFSRYSPSGAFIECTVRVTPKDLAGAHAIADIIESKLKSEFGDCKAMIHLEP